MKSLYENILRSTGSGKVGFLKNHLIRNGWYQVLATKVIRNEKYPAPSQYLKYREDDSLYVNIYVMSTLYIYDVNDLDDLKLVTDFWEASNEVDISKHKDSISRKKKTDAYQALKKGLKLRLTTRI